MALALSCSMGRTALAFAGAGAGAGVRARAWAGVGGGAARGAAVSWRLQAKADKSTKPEVEVMKRQDVVAEVAARTGLPKASADAAVSAFIDTVIEAVTEGKKVSFVGFGYFEPRQRAARSGRNPLTGEPLEIAASTAPVFSAAKPFKDRVKGG